MVGRSGKLAESAGRAPKTLLLIASGGQGHRLVSLLRKDLDLRQHYLWGWFSTPELMLVAGSVGADRGLSWEKRLWVEAVFVELAGPDPELFYWLLDNSTDYGAEELRATLVRYGIEQGWERELPADYRRIGAGSNLASPGQLGELWYRGIAGWNEGDGLFLSSAALAILEDKATLEQRIWRGQARVLLPLFD